MTKKFKLLFVLVIYIIFFLIFNMLEDSTIKYVLYAILNVVILFILTRIIFENDNN